MIIVNSNKCHTDILVLSKADCASVNVFSQSDFFHENAFPTWQYCFIKKYQIKFRK